MHTFLVAHPRKIAKRKDSVLYEIPTLYDVNGSANFYNMTDNGITIYRQFTEDAQTSHTVINVQKVKHKFQGKIGYCKFNFDSSCQRFNPKDDSLYNLQQPEKEIIGIKHYADTENNLNDNEEAF